MKLMPGVLFKKNTSTIRQTKSVKNDNNNKTFQLNAFHIPSFIYVSHISREQNVVCFYVLVLAEDWN